MSAPRIALTSEDIEVALDEAGLASREEPAEPYADVDPEEGELAALTPIDPALAEWIVGKLLSCDEEMARLEEQHQVRLAAVARRKARLEHRFGAELRTFVEGQLAGKKTKTLNLATGSCSLRKVPGGLRMQDSKLALEWAREHLPEAIEVKTTTTERVPADEIKAYVEATGVAVPGVVEVPDEVRFEVKPAKGRR
jgi:phage host-nuclease inhibitor protein Gam